MVTPAVVDEGKPTARLGWKQRRLTEEEGAAMGRWVRLDLGTQRRGGVCGWALRLHGRAWWLLLCDGLCDGSGDVMSELQVQRCCEFEDGSLQVVLWCIVVVID
ncbi:hypothetical protein M0R45_015126 [Rubus argutus]|uniref:Uncharacterized protein n=1 Tax=Rubus argutus TaxID=59490 RepID=A0AAW1XQS2_RUBAR